jgi:hypothetical protein
MENKTSEIISKNMQMLSSLIYNNIVLSKNTECLIVPSLDISIALQENGFDKSYPAYNYFLDAQSKSLIVNPQIITYYLLDCDGINDTAYYLINHNKKVMVLNGINEKSIQVMSGKEIESALYKAENFFNHITNIEAKKYDFTMYPQQVEEFLINIFRQLDFNELQYIEMIKYYLNNMLQMQDTQYNVLLLNLVYEALKAYVKQ